MANIGDISVSMGLDDSQWVAGVLRIQGSAKQLGGSLQGELGRSIGGIGFAIQDFSSVLSMGGKNALGRAMMSTMNNVQMLGAAFGPMGLAITSVGGALGSIFLPKLLESDVVVKTLADDIKDAVTEMGNMASASMSLSRSLVGIGNIDTSKGVKGRIEDLTDESGVVSRERRRTEARLTEEYNRAVSAGLLVDPGISGNVIDKLKSAALGTSKWMGSDLFPTGTKSGAAETRDALMKGAEALQKLIDEERRLSIVRDAASARLPALEKEEAKRDAEKEAEKLRKEEEREAEAERKKREREEKQEQERQERDAERERESRAREAEGIVSSSRSSFEVAQDRISAIRSLVRSGDLGEPDALKAAGKVLSDFSSERKNPANLAVEAVAAGTTEAFKAIQAAIRQDKGTKEDEQTKVLRDMLTALKDQLAAMRSNNKPAPRSEGID